jgi:hypothetical protein
MRDEPFCFWHAPETAEDAAEARRLGGLHRRKKRTVSAIYGFGGLRTVDDQLALLETTVIETMALEASLARGPTLRWTSGSRQWPVTWPMTLASVPTRSSAIASGQSQSWSADSGPDAASEPRGAPTR